MTLSNLEVDLVVRRRDFQNSGAEFGIDQFISDNWNVFARERPPDPFTDKVCVPLVVRRNGHRGISHNRFRPRRRHFQKPAGFINQFITHKIETSFLRLIDDFLVGQRCLRGRIPVNHAPSAIDQPLVVKIDKNLLNGANVIGVKSVALARPVAGTAEPLQLLNNDAAMFVLPFQNALQEFFAAKIVTRHSFVLPQPFLDRRLRPDAGVIRPR